MCGICGKIDENSICNKCRIKLKNAEILGIDEYLESDKNYVQHMYLFKYTGLVRQAILNYKFNEKSYIYKTFVKFLKNNEKIYLQIKKYDIIMPVPISKKRKMQRGYNQSSIIAKEIAKNFKKDYTEKVLIKKIDNKMQSTLNQKERAENVKGVYGIKKCKNILDKKVLLVDDIYTTGSTVNECSKILKQAGASQVGVFTIAKD